MDLLYTPLYAAILGLVYVCLSILAVKARRRNQVALGDGGKADLQRAIRAHANFIEYTPITLLLLYFYEMLGQPAFIINIIALAFTAGRLIHAYNISRADEKIALRVTGMALTFSSIIVLSVLLIVNFVINF